MNSGLDAVGAKAIDLFLDTDTENFIRDYFPIQNKIQANFF